MFSEDILMLILFIIYVICVFIEITALKKNNINIFYKENFLLILLKSAAFPLGILALIFGCNAISNMAWKDKNDIIMGGYFFTFILASLAYIVYYIKNRIYAFIPRKSKLSFLGYKGIYYKKDR